MKHVMVRTHGGLGNQVFQIFFARLFAEGRSAARLIRVHDSGYEHDFPASTVFRGLEYPSPLFAAISACRLPKTLHRMGWLSHEWIGLPGIVVLDGYFQHAEQYAEFRDEQISREVETLREELGITPGMREEVVHIRLGDFFPDERSQREYLEQRLGELPAGVDIITNRDDLLSDSRIKEILASGKNTLIPTHGLPAEAVLAYMASYRHIRANDSTLAFWASILGRAKLDLSDARLIKLRARLDI